MWMIIYLGTKKSTSVDSYQFLPELVSTIAFSIDVWNLRDSLHALLINSIRCREPQDQSQEFDWTASIRIPLIHAKRLADDDLQTLNPKWFSQELLMRPLLDALVLDIALNARERASAEEDDHRMVFSGKDDAGRISPTTSKPIVAVWTSELKWILVAHLVQSTLYELIRYSTSSPTRPGVYSIILSPLPD